MNFGYLHIGYGIKSTQVLKLCLSANRIRFQGIENHQIKYKTDVTGKNNENLFLKPSAKSLYSRLIKGGKKSVG